MNATTLRDRIMEPITTVWEKAENKEAHLSVAQLRELESQVREIFFEAKGEICEHKDLRKPGGTFEAENPEYSYCFDCGRRVERKSA